MCLLILLALLSFLLYYPSVQPYSPVVMYHGMNPYEEFKNDESSTSYPDYKKMDQGRIEESSSLKK